MNKDKVRIKVTCIDWTSKKVERICEVDREEYENNMTDIEWEEK